jgi:hypothetical protein
MDAGSLFWQTKGSPHFWNYRRPLGRKKGTIDDVKRSWEKVADRLSKSGWTWGCVATVDREGRLRTEMIESVSLCAQVRS